MRKIRGLWAVGILALLTAPMQSQQLPDPVNVKVVNYAELCELVAAQKDKVVLLDFWATWCKPCKESFFHTVEMYDKYKDKGLVVISVSTWDFTEDKSKEEKDAIQKQALKLLRGFKATFTNVILDEPKALVQEKLHMSSIPCLYVFNREGKWVQFIGTETLKEDKDHRHPDVENYVKYCLDQTIKKN